ncbi:TetR/AcrR family transcriptional regulator [Yersinia rohdei]|uniref:TetR/AcrR family transcriptional regulator n=1 Tax=Yersinia rohdei TaxID=29485 RepID=UPI00119F7245|nr:TetR/AcrR family transcriptional regulator [Yersinia rohdei]
MARPLDEDKRKAILAAALRVISQQGLGATTALIAKEAGISSGSLFTYFPDKVTLLNHLYTHIKTDVARALMQDFPLQASIRDKARHVWTAYINWALDHPQQRGALQQLSVSRVVTPSTREQSKRMFDPVNQMLAQLGEQGACDNVNFITAVMASLAESTLDFVVNDSKNEQELITTGFSMFCRAAGI